MTAIDILSEVQYTYRNGVWDMDGGCHEKSEEASGTWFRPHQGKSVPQFLWINNVILENFFWNYMNGYPELVFRETPSNFIRSGLMGHVMIRF